MLITEAHVPTDHPSRYLTQLCEHPGEIGGLRRRWSGLHHNGEAPPRIQRVEWSDTRGTIDVGWGRCALQAGPDSLTLRIEAADQDSLRRMQQLMAERLQKIGRRDAAQVTWEQAGTPHHRPDVPATAAPAPAGKAVPRPRSRAVLGLVAVIALVVAVHLVLGEVLLESGPGLHWIIGGVLAIILLHVLGSLAVRRGRSRRARDRATVKAGA